MMPGKDPLWMLYDTSAVTSMLAFTASAEFTRALDTEHRGEQLVHFFAAASQAVAKIAWDRCGALPTPLRVC